MSKFKQGSTYLVDYGKNRMKVEILEVTDTSVRITFENGVTTWQSISNFESEYQLVECIVDSKIKQLLQE
jgi:hypothetical protein